MKFRSTAAILATGVLLVGGVSACSSSGGSGGSSPEASSQSPNGVQDQEAAAILTASKAAVESATSVKVDAQTESEGQQVSFNMQMTNDSATGTVSQGSVSFELMSTPDMVYMKGDGALFESVGGAEAAKLLEGKWLAVPTDNQMAAGFASMASKAAFFKELLTPSSDMKKTDATKDFGGVPCIGLETSNGTLWVATVGEPYPMAIEPPSGTQGSMTMTDWNVPVTVTPPPENEVVDVSQLTGASQ